MYNFTIDFTPNKLQIKPTRQNALNRNKNVPSNESPAHFSNNASPTSSNAGTLQRKKQLDNSTKGNSENCIGNRISPTIPSTSRLGECRASDEHNCDKLAASSSYDAKNSASISSMMKYRSSISDLGDSNSALDRLTNTRLKSIKNRRGAVKYQKYVLVITNQMHVQISTVHES